MRINHNALYSDLIADLSEAAPGVNLYVDPDEWPGMSLQERRVTAMRTSFLKKFQDSTSTLADSVALENFLLSNNRCKKWDLRLENSGDELLWGQFREELYQAVHSNGYSIVQSTDQLCELGRTGPGASLGARGTDFYTKLFASPLTCTSEGIATIYQSYTERNPTWSVAERHRETAYGDYVIASGNRLSFVPKNDSTSRVICTEPNLNMFLQLGLGEVINRALYHKYGLDMENQQQVNRELARIGSISDSLCTIDLSAASDSVSLRMLEAACPTNFLLWLKLLRSPECELPDGSKEPLHMISSMGNGFTFPLETLIFSCVVASVYKLNNVKLEPTCVSLTRNKSQSSCSEVWEHGNFGVFGDDIICLKQHYRQIVRLLNILGFQVNEGKSFFEGPFRESCGGDYFGGQPCRGVYIKSLATPASRYVAINRLNEWTAITGIPLKRTIQRLIKSVRLIPVPLYENDDAGIKVPSDVMNRSPWARLIQSVDELPSDHKWSGLHGCIRYRRWAARPVKLRITDTEIRRPKGVKGRIYNPEGLLLAFLRGDIEQSALTVRHGSARYSTKWGVTSNWDHTPTVGKQFPIGQGRLANAIRANIC